MRNNKQKKQFNWIRMFSMLLIMLFCGIMLTGCIGRMGSWHGSSGSRPPSSGGSGGGTEDKPEKPTYDSSNYINDYNDVFAGAIAVFECDPNAEILYDKATNKNVSYKQVNDVQFDILASFLYSSLVKVYGSVAESAGVANVISRFGINYPYQFSDVIVDPTQKALALGIGYDSLANASQLYYANAIHGGENLTIATTEESGEDADGNPITVTKYNANYSGVNTANAWKSESSFNLSNLVSALKYIYYNTIDVEFRDDEVINASILKNAYAEKDMLQFIASYDENKINHTGFTKAYMHNVMYFLAYSVIGETVYDNSLSSKAVVFNGGSIKPFAADFSDESVVAAFENYKGYDVVIENIVRTAFNLSYPYETVNLSINDYWSGANWEKTLFPIVTRNQIVYYDDISDIADAKETDYSDPNYDFSNETEIVHGDPKKLKSIIYIPYIDSEKFSTRTTFAIDGIGCQLQSVSGSFSVKLIADVTFDSGEKLIVEAKFGEYDIIDNNRLIVDSEASEEDFVDAEFYESDDAKVFGNAVWSDDTVVGDGIKSSFKMKDITVENTGEVITIGNLNVNNALYKLQGNNLVIGINKNIIKLTFDYYDQVGIALTEVPQMYVNDLFTY